MAGLKFRILLDSVKGTEVFRDILIDDNFNFEDFYNVILDSFGLNNDQIASFFVSDEEWEKGEEITLMDMSFESSDEGEPPIEMNKLLLKNRINTPQQRFILVHDFLSMWIFLIELCETTDTQVEQPQVLLKVGEIPEELKEKGANSLDDLKFEGGDFNNDDFEKNGFDEFDDLDNLDDDYDDMTDYNI